MNRPVRTALLAALAASVIGCGQSGSPPPPPPPGNTPPVFTSPATVSVPENLTGVAYTVAATDANGDTLTFALTGGADAARFTFSATTRTLTFVASPDFEAPTDANGDNVYEVRFSVTDGVATVLLDVAITVTNVVGGFTVRRVSNAFSAPIFLTGLPDGSGRVAVVERAGRIRIMDPETGVINTTAFLDIASEISTAGEQGLLAIAFSPDFATDRRVFLHMNNLGGDTEIRRYETLVGDPARADPATGDIILAVDQPAATNHKGGLFAFTHDGHLLIGLGDGGSVTNTARQANSLLGKLLRIDPRTDDFPADPLRDYGIPAGNAFPTGGGAPEIWAQGLRNPFRGSVDPVTGDVFIADVGQSAVEEVNRLSTTVPGLVDFGWDLREGTQSIGGGAMQPSFTNPVLEYSHGSGPLQGRSITGGVVYRGPAEGLQGEYLFADFITNNIWSVPAANLVVGSTVPSSQFTIRTAQFAPDVGTVNSIVAFGTDTANNVYIVDIGGEIFRIEPSN